jgi:hypothetical protein
MFVHEYSDEHFATYEECAEDLLSEIDEEDIANELDLSVEEIIAVFLRNKNNVDFSVWFQEKIDSGIAAVQEALITEYEDEEVD